MSKINKEKKLLGLSLLGAFASSICCIVPLVAFIAGLGGFASTFSQLDTYRPFFMVFTIFVLSFAWFNKLKPQKKIECKCNESNKSAFMQSKKFLGIVTVFAFLMMAFPYYSTKLFPQRNIANNRMGKNNLQNLKLEIVGMTCDGCETFIEQTVYSIRGVDSVKADYNTGSAFIVFDSALTDNSKIIKIINSTNYKVKN